jgi:hypothetical protein
VDQLRHLNALFRTGALSAPMMRAAEMWAGDSVAVRSTMRASDWRREPTKRTGGGFSMTAASAARFRSACKALGEARQITQLVVIDGHSVREVAQAAECPAKEIVAVLRLGMQRLVAYYQVPLVEGEAAAILSEAGLGRLAR